MAHPSDDDRLANLLGAVALGLFDTVGDIASANDLDITAMAALVSLADLARSTSVQGLSQLIGISHSGTVRLINRLVEAGLVERQPGPDARTLAVALTRRGRSAAARLRTSRRTAIVATLSGMSAQQRDQLADTCEQLIVNLTSARLATRRAGGQPSGGALCRLCDPNSCGRPMGRCPAARTAAQALG
ncbi:MarR family winged helix-turn-helix transcriptional regulator [Mycolicibacterium sp. CBMA 226]|uniref:MarR family winged helix-turn-helix transcriptional regulator n=1 Tax=Mycolicibacterium sp. CBMA 226 TaxID=2606611 RepID=UPI0014123040|nr:MarR family transcriptional regulator [Mycolicibacterium sp. CBMA 226]